MKGSLPQRAGRRCDIGSHMDPVPERHDGRLTRLKRGLQRQVGNVPNRGLVRSVEASGEHEHGTQAEAGQRDFHGAIPLRSRV